MKVPMADSGITNSVSARSISPRSIRRFEQASDVLAPDDNSVAMVRSFVRSIPLTITSALPHFCFRMMSIIYMSTLTFFNLENLSASYLLQHQHCSSQNLVILLGHKIVFDPAHLSRLSRVDLLHIAAGST